MRRLELARSPPTHQPRLLLSQRALHLACPRRLKGARSPVPVENGPTAGTKAPVRGSPRKTPKWLMGSCGRQHSGGTGHALVARLEAPRARGKPCGLQKTAHRGASAGSDQPATRLRLHVERAEVVGTQPPRSKKLSSPELNAARPHPCAMNDSYKTSTSAPPDPPTAGRLRSPTAFSRQPSRAPHPALHITS